MGTKTKAEFEVKLLGEPEYHRNGISGEPFYSAMILVIEDGNSKALLATWRTDDEGKVDPVTCRVVNMSDKTDHYRGDRIGEQLKAIVRRVE